LTPGLEICFSPDVERPRHLLLTGVTGSLGRELLAVAAAREPGARISCLIRPRRGRAPAERLARLTARIFPGGVPAGLRIEAVAGDIEQPGLGLTDADREALEASVTDVVHGAASVAFTLPIADARRINVDGTRNVLALARAAHARGGLRRFDYISTAYVAGERRGIIAEDCFGGAPFRNTYERSKFEAEAEVRRAFSGGLPGAVFRPSIILGHSQTGFTSSFKVLYWPLRVYATGLWRVAPGSADNSFDFVPVDYVAQALFWIRAHAAPAGQTYHLCAGPDRAATAREICALASREFGRKPVIWVDPRIYLGLINPVVRVIMVGRYREVVRTGQAFVPYLISDMRFDTHLAQAALVGSRLSPPRVTDYFDNLFWFCRRSNWGTVEVPPAELAMRLARGAPLQEGAAPLAAAAGGAAG
jgi:long-chain acyl-CoA synthetase